MQQVRVHLNLNLEMIFGVLCKYLICAADMEVTLLVLTVTVNRRIRLLMMLFFTSLCKPLKTDSTKAMCAYAT